MSGIGNILPSTMFGSSGNSSCMLGCTRIYLRHSVSWLHGWMGDIMTDKIAGYCCCGIVISLILGLLSVLIPALLHLTAALFAISCIGFVLAIVISCASDLTR